MANKTTKLDEKSYVTLCNNLNVQLNAAYGYMADLSKAMKIMLKGDGTDPYWGGAPAINFFRSGKANIDHDIVAYKESVEAWQRLRDRYLVLLKKGYFKK